MRMSKSARKRYLSIVNKKRHRLSKRHQTLSGPLTISWTVGMTFYTVPIDKHSASRLQYMARYMCGRRSFLSPWGSLVDYFKDSSRMYPPFYILRHNKAKQQEFISNSFSRRNDYRSEKKKQERDSFWNNIFPENVQEL